ncbi:MAG: hypothetical protein C6I00_06570 [Nitratiruptor sp.]|nr:hypothetical protein [Nitratiruptor sp.]NPA83107.1 response regulator transcription factor [Campylobacterota bacterium]
MRILLVEDDYELASTIVKYLSKEGFALTHCFDIQCAKEQLNSQEFGLLLLDVKLPGQSGFEFLEQNSISIPTIYITSLNSIADIQRGFESGAIEYIKKPFSLKELLLRIKAALRNSQPERIPLGPHHFFLPQQGVLLIDTKRHYLPPKEEALLRLLLQKRGSLVPTEELLEVAKSKGALRTYIKGLRKLLPPGSIETVKGRGYRLVPRD